MDFVVVGFGLGALGVLLGVVMLGWLAPHAERAAARAGASDDAARDLAVATEHRGTGQAFLYGGAAMLLATVGGLAGALDDRTGALLVTTTATVAAIGIVLGGFLQRARHPVPRRRRPSHAIPSAAVAPDQPLNETTVSSEETAAADPGAAEAWKMFLDDHDEDRVIPFSVPAAVPESAAGNAAPVPGSNGGPTSGDVEPDHVGDVPVEAAPSPEGELNAAPQESQLSDDADLVEQKEEEAVIVGYVVPADAPRPLTRRDKEEDPS